MDADERLRGSGLGLAAALLFGLGAPLSKLLLPSARPLTLAALLYLGAGAAFMVARRRAAEARLTRAPRPLRSLALAGRWTTTSRRSSRSRTRSRSCASRRSARERQICFSRSPLDSRCRP